MKLRFKDWKIRTKILISLIAIMVFFLYVIIRSYSAIIDFTGNKIPLILSNEAINTELLEMKTHEKDFLLYEASDLTLPADHQSTYLDEFEKSYDELVNNLNSVRQSPDISKDGEMKKRLAVIEETAKTYHDGFLSVADSIKQKGNAYDIPGSLSEGYQDAAGKLSPMITDFHNSIMEELNRQVGYLIKVIVIITLLIIAAVLSYSLYVSRVITRPINMTNRMLRDIAEGEGDLTKELTINTKEELGTLASWFNLFIGKIKDIVGIVQNNADTIADSTVKLTGAAEHANQEIESISREILTITDGLQNNAGIIEEATASIQEMAGGAVLVSNEAEDAAKNSHTVLAVAGEGAQTLKEMTDTMQGVQQSSVHMYEMMEELKESSGKIDQIAELITGISEQTNLLALNAAIEAARAGESGKGFAVVAEEVRKLAEDSKKSADDISYLIKTVEEKVELAYEAMRSEQELVSGSVSKAGEADERFKSILSLISETAGKITNISKAAKQQSAVTGEMSKAMEEISVSTQESAASSQLIGSNVTRQVNTFEEIKANIRELNTVAQTLKDQTNRFKTR